MWQEDEWQNVQEVEAGEWELEEAVSALSVLWEQLLYSITDYVIMGANDLLDVLLVSSELCSFSWIYEWPGHTSAERVLTVCRE